MKLGQVILGQTVRTANQEQAEAKQDPNHYVIDLVRALQNKYKFLQVPSNLGEFDFSKGLKFNRGWFTREIVIDKLEIYHNGIIVEGRHPTEALDDFANDLLEWAKKEYGLGGLDGPRAYLSNFEVTSEIGLGKKFEYLSSVGQAITLILESYGQKPKPFKVTQIGFHADTTDVPFPVAPFFQFDRRAGKPYSENSYFCSSPLKTKDALSILEKLETIFGS